MENTHFQIRVVGLMSGTSLDGLDICCADFVLSKKQWSYKIVQAETVHYSNEQKKWFKSLENTTAETLAFAHFEFGKYMGEAVNTFLKKNAINGVNLISTHGHTLFHQPENGFTFQLGHPGAIASVTEIETAGDFRSQDVVLGGQGAPLIPAGEKHLFSNYQAFINLGGIANLSVHTDSKIVAFDICPFNQVLNTLAERLGLPFDHAGAEAKKGSPYPLLLAELNALDYYQKSAPKSLGAEWVNAHIWPLINLHDLETRDALATFLQHSVEQIAASLEQYSIKKVLLSGGGTHNSYFVELLKNKLPDVLLDIHDKNTTDFKEALVFAFLGVLRKHEEHNCYASVTGSKRNTSSGCIYLP